MVYRNQGKHWDQGNLRTRSSQPCPSHQGALSATFCFTLPLLPASTLSPSPLLCLGKGTGTTTPPPPAAEGTQRATVRCVTSPGSLTPLGKNSGESFWERCGRECPPRGLVRGRWAGTGKRLPRRRWALTAGVHRVLFRLLFPFTTVFWDKALSSGKQEGISCKKISHFPGLSFFPLFFSDVQSHITQTLQLPLRPGTRPHVPLLQLLLQCWSRRRVGRKPMVPGRDPSNQGNITEKECLNNLHHQLLPSRRFWMVGRTGRNHTTVCRGWEQ